MQGDDDGLAPIESEAGDPLVLLEERCEDGKISMHMPCDQCQIVCIGSGGGVWQDATQASEKEVRGNGKDQR